MDWLKGILEFANGFLSAPLGQAILLVIVVGLVGFFLRGWSKDRLLTKKIEAETAKGKLDGEIRKMELENERKENDQHALSDAEHRATLAKLAENQAIMLAIMQRGEARDVVIQDMARDIHKNTLDLKQGAAVVNKNVLLTAGKVDNAMNDSRDRTNSLREAIDKGNENTWKIANERHRQVEGSLHGLKTELFKKLMEIETEIRTLGADIRASANGESAALNRLNAIERKFDDFVLKFVATKADPFAAPTVASAVTRRKSDPSIALPSINPPVVQSGQPDTPMTGKHDTQPLPVTPPPTPAKPTESN